MLERILQIQGAPHKTQLTTRLLDVRYLQSADFLFDLSRYLLRLLDLAEADVDCWQVDG